ncbi:hypothetical protein [Nocardiopsis sp. CA-288880]|uniref:hypothetical protein n=1 Tax=Nocardiopsis sp. CA-288880 TaxID=3239995 RepID=UPI003D98AFB7
MRLKHYLIVAGFAAAALFGGSPAWADDATYPTGTPNYPVAIPGYPSETPNYPVAIPGYPSETPNYPVAIPGYPTGTPNYPVAIPGYPTGVPAPVECSADPSQQLALSAGVPGAEAPVGVPVEVPGAEAPVGVPVGVPGAEVGLCEDPGQPEPESSAPVAVPAYPTHTD